LLAGWLIDKYTYADGWSCASYAVAVISGFVLVGFLCFLINIDRRFDATIYSYETTIEMVDSYAGQDYGNMGSLVEQVVAINNTIAAHKAHHDSKWVGLWYSEEIGSLEPITFDKKVQDVPALE
jgi:hypothetical protein